ncbi:hypothetical protein [Hansschlegelia zhihuaiae]|uniref:Uncharacterized protein n=1 Tax=Hansschlegelia zhihuaiae TaxID=405005 RepID=A0A4Q0M6S0_9HYPH|nr:hypothetical protein [Hansschlegelia zhihuaiae]RXF68760.1 hypothetical protein EK403_19565 [Hansschlegelia zhihuaiae]
MRRPACALAAAAFAAVPASALPAKYYQENVFKSCSTGGIFCQAVFPAIPADRVLRVNSASCRVFLSSRTAVFSHVQLGSDKGDGPFYLDVTSISNASGRTFMATFAGPVFLSQSSAPRVSTYATGASTVSFDCNISGVLEKAPLEAGPAAAEAEAD